MNVCNTFLWINLSFSFCACHFPTPNVIQEKKRKKIKLYIMLAFSRFSLLTCIYYIDVYKFRVLYSFLFFFSLFFFWFFQLTLLWCRRSTVGSRQSAVGVFGMNNFQWIFLGKLRQTSRRFNLWLTNQFHWILQNRCMLHNNFKFHIYRIRFR